MLRTMRALHLNMTRYTLAGCRSTVPFHISVCAQDFKLLISVWCKKGFTDEEKNRWEWRRMTLVDQHRDSQNLFLYCNSMRKRFEPWRLAAEHTVYIVDTHTHIMCLWCLFEEALQPPIHESCVHN